MDKKDTSGKLPDPTLSSWYAEPLSMEQAQQLLDSSHKEEQTALLDTGQVFRPRINQMIARYWLGKNIEHNFRSLCATFPGDYEQALLHLVYGQLLISCKRSGAREYLRRGFVLSVPYLASGQYFDVMKRHQHLERLSLTPAGHSAQSLRDLLREAGVIERLTGQVSGSNKSDHKDTLG